jgi:uncharacterized membrane protein YeiB
VIEVAAVLALVRPAVSVRVATSEVAAVVIAVTAAGLVAVAVTDAPAVLVAVTEAAVLALALTEALAVVAELSPAVSNRAAVTELAEVTELLTLTLSGATTGRISKATILLSAEALHVPPKVVAPGVPVNALAFHAVMWTPSEVSLKSPPLARAVVAPLRV